jgi:hypothetical protein
MVLNGENSKKAYASKNKKEERKDDVSNLRSIKLFLNNT